MSTHCFVPIRGKRIRVTRLDNCGRVPKPSAASSWIATDGFITVSLSAEVEDGSEIMQKNASGGICVNERTSPSFKRFNVEAEFCGVNPSLMAMMTSAKEYKDFAGDVAGFTQGEGAIDEKFALELWSGLAGQACGAGADEASGYFLLPFIQGGSIGDIEFGEENAVNFSLTGAYTMGQNAWGVGPYLVVNNKTGVASKLPTALDPMDHLLMLDTGLALPPVACDPQPMPDASGTTTTTSTTTTTTKVS